MVKCLENLVTLYRTLITLCGILIVVYVSYSPKMAGVPTPDELKAFGDKLDFFGLKFPVAGICNVGSILVVVLLIMMLNSTRTSKKLPLKELADAGFWHGQFLGFSVLLTFCSFILLPFAAVASAQIAVWMRPPVPANVSSWDSTLLWSQAWGLVLVGLTLLFSGWLWGENWWAARCWLRKLRLSEAPRTKLLEHLKAAKDSAAEAKESEAAYLIQQALAICDQPTGSNDRRNNPERLARTPLVALPKQEHQSRRRYRGQRFDREPDLD